MATNIKPVTDRIALVDSQGRINPYWLDVFRGFEKALGGPGSVTIPQTNVVEPVTNQLVRFGPNSTLQSTGMVADTDLTLPSDLLAVGGVFSGNVSGVTAAFTGNGSFADVFGTNGVFTGTLDFIGKLERFETVVGQAALASAGTVTLLPALAGEQWKVMEIMISGAGTNFSGGDRNLDVKEGTTVYSTITAARLQALAAERWGGTGVPFPGTPVHLTTATAAGQDIVAQYSGGLTDYTAGSCTIILTAARTS